METIYLADAQEIVLALDLHYDLSSAGELLDTYPSPHNDVDEDEIGRREQENARRVEAYEEAYLATLRKIGAERHVTIYVGHQGQETSTFLDVAYGYTLENSIWQEAHDRTPLPWIEKD
jgi:hypothetical protein